MTEYLDHELTFGRYAGHTVGYVIAENRSYAVWCVSRPRLWRDRRDDLEALGLAVVDLLLDEMMRPGSQFTIAEPNTRRTRPAKPKWDNAWGPKPSDAMLRDVARELARTEVGQAWLARRRAH